VEIIDTHHHLWDLNELRYPWLLERVTIQIARNFDSLRGDYVLPDHVSDRANAHATKSVHVKADDRGDTVAETLWLQALADADASTAGFPEHRDVCRPEHG
jgi:predicted TIM-barrel fold metal-dependent hydrolase